MLGLIEIRRRFWDKKQQQWQLGVKIWFQLPRLFHQRKLLRIALKHISSENFSWIFPPSLGMTPYWLLSMESESESINVPWISPSFPRNDPSLASQHGIGAEMEQSIGPRSSHTQRERQRQNCKRQRQNWKRQRQKMGQSIEPTHHHHHHHMSVLSNQLSTALLFGKVVVCQGLPEMLGICKQVE